MDIFTNQQPDTGQDALRDAMAEQYAEDARIIASDGRIPDWWGEPRPLEKSLARVLNYTYEVGPFSWDNRATANNRRLTSAFGFHSPINAYDAVLRCHDDGLLEYGDGVYYMSQQGEYALEEWLDEAEVSGMSVDKALADIKDEWDVDEEFAKLWGLDK